MPPLPSAAVSAAIAAAIATSSSLLARTLHCHVIRTHPHPFPPTLSNHLVSLYSKLGLVNSARLVLSLTPSPSVVTFTALISGAAATGHVTTSLLTFSLMRRLGIPPNHFTFPSVFKAAIFVTNSHFYGDFIHGSAVNFPNSHFYGESVNGLAVNNTNSHFYGESVHGSAIININSYFYGKSVHGLVIKDGNFIDCYVGCSVFDMYCKMGFLEDANKVFDEMPVRNLPTWNAYISNSVLNGRPENAINAFIKLRRVESDGPDRITLCAFLNACADGSYLKLGQTLHGFVIRYGYGENVSVCNGLIDFYGKCKEIGYSEMVFEKMRYLNDVSWSSMVACYEQNDEQEKACSVFLNARKINVEIKDFMISSVLSACAGIAGLDLGRCVHNIAIKICLENNVFVGSSLVDMYGKCGSIEDCERAFYETKNRNLVTYNALLGGYAHLGHADVALELFRKITNNVDGVVPNYVTIVCILSACSRAGKVREGMEIFESMREKFGIKPGIEHYACVVDMLARAGKVEKAYDFIKKMPIDPTVSVWGALLGGCRVYGKSELGKIAAYKLFKLDPQDSGNHVLLSNMFAAAGRWEEANLVRKEMMEVGIKKGAGCSWVSLKDKIHVFQAKDKSHERNSEIQAMLTKLKILMKQSGYSPDTKFALYDLEEEERESEVWHHSEKIALAFGLIAIPHGIPIRITKNLRVCVDCHSAIKFISGIVGREIIVRDNNRFHRFRDNLCSCNDYW